MAKILGIVCSLMLIAHFAEAKLTPDDGTRDNDILNFDMATKSYGQGHASAAEVRKALTALRKDGFDLLPDPNKLSDAELKNFRVSGGCAGKPQVLEILDLTGRVIRSVSANSGGYLPPAKAAAALASCPPGGKVRIGAASTSAVN